ncbi:hypothetical protein FXO38_27977 [Capsicum annuum]|nr:hypothetical protein FXO38_27977 [Capsicum annuum]
MMDYHKISSLGLEIFPRMTTLVTSRHARDSLSRIWSSEKLFFQGLVTVNGSVCKTPQVKFRNGPILQNLIVVRLDVSTTGASSYALAASSVVSKGKLLVVQIVNPARRSGKDVQEGKRETYSTAERINQIYGRSNYEPVILIDRLIPRYEKTAYYVVAESPSVDVTTLLSSLSNDPNKIVYIVSERGRSSLSEWLVPRERLRIAAEHGYFISCRFYRSLSGAIRVNPWDIKVVAGALNMAITISDFEKQLRHEVLPLLANSAAARIRDFTQMNPLFFLRSKVDEDHQEFIDQVQKVTDIMRSKRLDDAGPIEWEEFITAFLDRFFPQELREAKVLEFINLRQGNMTVKEYSLKFTQLPKYAPHVVTDSRAKMRLIANSEHWNATAGLELMPLNLWCNIRENSIAQMRHAPVSKFREGNRDRAPGSRSQDSVRNVRTNPLCQTYGKNPKDACKAGSNVCFGCGKLGHRVTDRPQSADLVELKMTNFDIILSMDWLHSYYATVDCRNRIVKFQFSNEPILEWKGSTSAFRGQLISYLWAQKIISKGCVYHLVRVKNTSSTTLSLESVLVVGEYSDIFPEDLPEISPKREIDFDIDILPDTHPISIPPYRMALAKLRELKEQLKDLLDKGFIRPSVYPERDHVDYLRTVLQTLRDHQLFVKFTPVLALPDGFVVYYDASKVGLGYVLMQHGKANIVVDALSRLSMGSVAHVDDGVRLVDIEEGDIWVQSSFKSSLVSEVKEKQDSDLSLVKLKESVQDQKVEVFSQRGDGVLHCQGHLHVLGVDDLRQRILAEAYGVRYSIHPGAINIYRDLWEIYWWSGMKRDIVEFMAKCSTCQKVKIEHQKPSGSMRNLVFLLESGKQRYPFTSHFWKAFQKGLGTQVHLSIAFHPQTDIQAERTIQTLKDILRACAIDFKGIWDDHLPLIEFAYNNSYYSSIQMAPFEALYGMRYRSPIGWFKVSEASVIGPDLVFDALEKVQLIRERLWATQSRQKSYAEVHRKDLEFEISDQFGKVAYELELPSDLASVHPAFHVSLLKKFIVKVLWQNQSIEGATWEEEADIRTKYPHLFSANSDQAQGSKTRAPISSRFQFQLSELEIRGVTISLDLGFRVVLLSSLSNNLKNTVYIISERGKSSLSEWLVPCERLGIVAEYGYFIRVDRNHLSNAWAWKKRGDVARGAMKKLMWGDAAIGAAKK